MAVPHRAVPPPRGDSDVRFVELSVRLYSLRFSPSCCGLPLLTPSSFFVAFRASNVHRIGQKAMFTRLRGIAGFSITAPRPQLLLSCQVNWGEMHGGSYRQPRGQVIPPTPLPAKSRVLTLRPLVALRRASGTWPHISARQRLRRFRFAPVRPSGKGREAMPLFTSPPAHRIASPA